MGSRGGGGGGGVLGFGGFFFRIPPLASTCLITCSA